MVESRNSVKEPKKPHPETRAMRWWAALTSSTAAPDAQDEGGKFKGGRFYKEFTAEAARLNTRQKIRRHGRKWRIWPDGSKLCFESGMDHGEHVYMGQTIYLQTYPIEEDYDEESFREHHANRAPWPAHPRHADRAVRELQRADESGGVPPGSNGSEDAGGGGDVGGDDAGRRDIADG